MKMEISKGDFEKIQEMEAKNENFWLYFVADEEEIEENGFFADLIFDESNEARNRAKIRCSKIWFVDDIRNIYEENGKCFLEGNVTQMVFTEAGDFLEKNMAEEPYFDY